MTHLCLDVRSTETVCCFSGRQSSVWQQRKHTLSDCFISLRLVQSFTLLCIKSKICHFLTGTTKSNYIPLFNLKPPFVSQGVAGPHVMTDGSGWYKTKSSWLSAYWTWNCKMLSERPERNPRLVWWKMAVTVQAWATASTLKPRLFVPRSSRHRGTGLLFSKMFLNACWRTLLGSLLHHKRNTLNVHRVLVNVSLSLISGS